MMTQDRYPQELIRFLEASPTAFHAAARCADLLAAHGFVPLRERDEWGELAPGAHERKDTRRKRQPLHSCRP